jgi:hypothetical protein
VGSGRRVPGRALAEGYRGDNPVRAWSGRPRSTLHRSRPRIPTSLSEIDGAGTPRRTLRRDPVKFGARLSGDRWRTARTAKRLLASEGDTVARERADGSARGDPKCRQRRYIRRRCIARAGHVAAQNATGRKMRVVGALPRAIGSVRAPGTADARNGRQYGACGCPRRKARHDDLKHEHVSSAERNPGTRSLPLLTE